MLIVSCGGPCSPNAALPLPDPPPPWTAPAATGTQNLPPRARDADMGDHGLSVVIELDKPISGAAPPPSAFRVVVGSTLHHVASVVAHGTHVHLSLATPAQGEVGLVSYSRPTTNPLQDSEGRQVASFENLAIN